MAKSNLYTRKGDDGSTGLVGGTRVSKADRRIDLYGDVDELNSFLGVVSSFIKDDKKYQDVFKQLLEIQHNLFNLGSNLACEEEKRESYKLPIISEESVNSLEKDIDELDSHLNPLKYFVLPGGHILASHLHVCRTICRRVERKLVEFYKDHYNDAPKNSTVYINRLSDYFFVLSRYINHVENEDEVYWVPKTN